MNSLSQTELRGTALLVVDLDDTLIRADLLLEQMLAFVKAAPWKAPLLLAWAVQGPRRLKGELALRVPLEAQALPYRRAVLDHIEQARGAGREVVLASASPEGWVQKVADHLGLFHQVLGTTASINLKGAQKLRLLQEKFPNRSFEYVGDSAADLALWEAQPHCSMAVAVNPSARVRSRLRQRGIPVRFIEDADANFQGAFQAYFKALRVHQWSKNLLIFLPLLLAHRFQDRAAVQQTLLAFFAFSATASAVYIMNDLLDLGADRRHSTKSRRPFATGRLSVLNGVALIPVLFGVGASLASALAPAFAGVLFLYLVLNLMYSFRLKKELAIDVVLLGVMYSLRIFSGGAATEILVSPWLIAFSTFFFFGLALLKRYTEVSRLGPVTASTPGRGYRGVDAPVLLGLGVGASVLSVLIFVLYLQSPTVGALYQHPERLGLLTPLLLYWVTRIWILAVRGEVHDDPVVFAIRDRTTAVVAVGFLLVFFWALL